jgi:outer membrane protein assembly factor BamD
MNSRQTLLLRTVATVMMTAGLGACGMLGGGDRVRANEQYVDEPVAELYNRGADLLDRGRYAMALAAFEEVERQHPYSSWARRSMLMEAFTHYQANDYDDAIEDAQRFIALHPGNESAPYAYYLVAVSQFERILDVGRDQGTTERALTALNDVVRRYPESAYARDARLKLDMVYDQLAGKEMEVGRFYLMRDQELAAVNRFRTVIENPNYQRTSHVPEALHRLVEAYLTMGMTEEAQRSAAILGHNYPGNEWYERSYQLMTESGVAPVATEEAERRGWFGRTFGAVF